jgi:hypothetical protein|tara:strand:- start:178 stop:1038 length:861 start_codon:yes stop_codon:yes gene_type:complete
MRHDMPWKPLEVMIVGDVQYGAAGFNLKKFRDHIDYAISKKMWYIGLGDYVDVMSPSGRKNYARFAADAYDSTLETVNEAAERHVDTFLDLVKGTEGRWFGLVEGHHYFPFNDGTTSDTRIAEALGAPFLGTQAYIGLRLIREKKDSNPASRQVDFLCKHGVGGGGKLSSQLLKLENWMNEWTADVYTTAHATKITFGPKTRIGPVWGKKKAWVKEEKKLLVSTGGYMAGYDVGSTGNTGGMRPQGSYVEKAGMAPVALGSPVVKLTPVHNKVTDEIRLGYEYLGL